MFSAKQLRRRLNGCKAHFKAESLLIFLVVLNSLVLPAGIGLSSAEITPNESESKTAKETSSRNATTTTQTSKHTFRCKADGSEISKLKVCNFLLDCPDGQDESACGTCNFNRDPKVQCGLEFEVDDNMALEWRLSDISPDIERAMSPWPSGAGRQQDPDARPTGSIRLEIAQHVAAALELQKREPHLHLRLTEANHKAKIKFPQLRPTDNPSCQFNMWIHSSLNLAHGQHQNNDSATPTSRPKNQSICGGGCGGAAQFDWPRLSVLLIRPQDYDWSAEPDTWAPQAVELLSETSFCHTNDWFELVVRVGKRLEAFWSLLVVIETRLESNRLSFGHFAYENCEPLNVAKLEETFEVAAADMTTLDCRPDDQFKCEASGKCISSAYRCDFGRDCGPNDDSDEFRCSGGAGDQFLGRCDFESPHECGWLATPADSWRWASPSDGAAGGQLTGKPEANSSGLFKPHLDHTYLSERQGGHFMLIDAHRLDAFRLISLLGPRVGLRKGARDCYFRLWLNTPTRLAKAGLVSPYLTINYRHVFASELFGASSLLTHGPKRHEEFGWRLFEFLLADDKSQLEPLQNGRLRQLKISFGNLSETDMEKFALHDGYLALDDFSFSPGCRLVSASSSSSSSSSQLDGQQQVDSSTDQDEGWCAAGQFQCPVISAGSEGRGSPVWWYPCLPENRICDFKIDCIMGEAPDGMLHDEFACPSQCRLDGPVVMDLAKQVNGTSAKRRCGFEIVEESFSDELLASDQVRFNRAIEVSFERDGAQATGATKLVFKANSDQFNKNRQEHFNQTTAFGQQSAGNSRPSSTTTTYVNIFAGRVKLPTFSQAHANCTFNLKFRWSRDANNLRASVFLMREMSAKRQLFSHLVPTSAPASARNRNQNQNNNNNNTNQNESSALQTPIQTLEFGIGEQNRKFSMNIEVNFEDSTAHYATFGGSLEILSYRFEECQHRAGELDRDQFGPLTGTGKPADSGRNHDDDDDVEPDWLDEAEEPDLGGCETPGCGQELQKTAEKLACPPNQFQCNGPLLCLPEALVCDMQRDCQESNADELNCRRPSRLGGGGYQIYDFESGDDLTQSGWRQESGSTTTTTTTTTTNALWSARQVDVFARRWFNVGPPIDHTRRDELGHYLALTHRPELNDRLGAWYGLRDEQSLVGVTYSPAFKASVNCARLVFYLYHWQGATLSQPNSFMFRVFLTSRRRRSARGRVDIKLLYEMAQSDRAEQDRWQRIELPLTQADMSFEETTKNSSSSSNSHDDDDDDGGDDDVFQVAFLGRLTNNSGGRENVFALDDVVFGPECDIAVRQSTTGDLALPQSIVSGELTNLRRESTPAPESLVYIYVGRPFIALLILAALVVVVGAALRRWRQQAPAQPTSNRVETDARGDYVAMQPIRGP